MQRRKTKRPLRGSANPLLERRRLAEIPSNCLAFHSPQWESKRKHAASFVPACDFFRSSSSYLVQRFLGSTLLAAACAQTPPPRPPPIKGGGNLFRLERIFPSPLAWEGRGGGNARAQFIRSVSRKRCTNRSLLR